MSLLSLLCSALTLLALALLLALLVLLALLPRVVGGHRSTSSFLAVVCGQWAAINCSPLVVAVTRESGGIRGNKIAGVALLKSFELKILM